jgi:hypothetical protein
MATGNRLAATNVKIQSLHSMVRVKNVLKNHTKYIIRRGTGHPSSDIIVSSKLLTKVLSLLWCIYIFEQFFSYLATVTIAGDRAANLDMLSSYGF